MLPIKHRNRRVKALKIDSTSSEILQRNSLIALIAKCISCGPLQKPLLLELFMQLPSDNETHAVRFEIK